MKRIVVIGGGTGTFTVLSGLKKYSAHLSAVISMTDSGGSNRVLRDEFGLLPTSDIRQCIVALASPRSNGLLRDLFTYRYSRGTGISGMSFGNLFMVALTDIYGSQEKAIEATTKMLQVKGDIYPVTYDKTNLVARYENGKQVMGEHYIDDPDKRTGKNKIVELSVFPEAHANKKALKAIEQADLVLFGPGDLYTSIICNLVVAGIAEAIVKSKAKKVFVMNLMTKFGQTNNFTAQDHLDELEKYLGKGSIDIVLINKNEKVERKVLKKYAQEHAVQVVDDLGNRKGLKVVQRNFASAIVHKNAKADKLKRSLVRHDSDKLAKAVMSLL